jgi:hypothetical protein
LTSALEGGEWSASHPQLLLPGGKSLWYPLDSRLGWLQSWSRHCEVQKNLLSLPGIESQLSSLYPITMLIELPWLHRIL